jgi:hypothetical protein
MDTIPQDEQVSFLFGAGASFGYSNGATVRPPLGRDLFGALSASALCPTWHRADIQALFARYPGDFETPMASLCEGTYSETLTHLTHELCHYLSRFTPAPAGENLYIRLIEQIVNRNRLHNTLLATLNYETLLDESILLAGCRLHYVYPKSSYPTPGAQVLKLHGSVNFLPPPGFHSNSFPDASASDNLYQGPIYIQVPGKDFRDLYDEGLRWPFICHYAPEKPYHIHPALKELPLLWNERVTQCSAVVVIGVNADSLDPHVWDPVLRGSARVYYVGRDGQRLANSLGDRFSHIGDTFEAALPAVLKLL